MSIWDTDYPADYLNNLASALELADINRREAQLRYDSYGVAARPTDTWRDGKPAFATPTPVANFVVYLTELAEWYSQVADQDYAKQAAWYVDVALLTLTHVQERQPLPEMAAHWHHVQAEKDRQSEELGEWDRPWSVHIRPDLTNLWAADNNALLVVQNPRLDHTLLTVYDQLLRAYTCATNWEAARPTVTDQQATERQAAEIDAWARGAEPIPNLLGDFARALHASAQWLASVGQPVEGR